jgi:peptide/nickel transport system substrate-binding protein
MNRNQLIVIVLIVVVVGAAGAYILLTPQVPTGVTFISETIGNPDYLDPAVNYETYGGGIHSNVYETLYTYEWDTLRTDPAVPLLATDVTISSDGKEYTFPLRQGVTFHDGTPFNASCVKFIFERLLAICDSSGPVWMIAEYIYGGPDIWHAVLDYGEGSPQHEGNWTAWVAANDAGTGGVTVVDDYTVKIKLEAAYGPWLSILAGAWCAMISPTYVENHGGVVVGSHNEWMDEHTCGTGPYMVTEWVVDERIVMERYENYWREADAKSQFPYAGSIDKIISKTNEDVSSRILNLKAGEAHHIYVPATHAFEFYNNVTPPDFATYDGRGQSVDAASFKVWAKYPTFSIAEIHFTMSETMNETTLNKVVKNPFYLMNVRKALCYAFNYQTGIDTILNGIGVQGEGPVPIGMFGHYTGEYPYEHDLEKAVEYWNAAMNDDDLDDILENCTYRIILYHNSGNEVRRKAQLLLKDSIQAMLDTEGCIQPSEELTIDVQGLEWSTYLHAAIDCKVGCWMIGWAPDFADPDNYVYPYVHSAGTFSGWARIDESPGWDAEEVDGWIADAAASTDEDERQQLYQDIQEAIINHAAYIWCFQTATLHVVRANVYNTHYVCNPMRWMAYYYHCYVT